MKKSLRIFILLNMLIFVSTIFSGCAEINYSTIKTKDGGIVEKVTALIDEQSLIDANYNVNIKKLEIEQIATSAMQELVNDYNQKIQQQIHIYTVQQDQEMIASFTDLLDDVTALKPYWENTVFNCQINFDSVSAYCLFYDLTETNFSTQTTRSNWWSTKITYSGNLGYAINSGLYSILKTKLNLTFLNFSDQDTNLSYSYLARSKRYHSNSDYVLATTDGYLHTWKIDSSNIDKEIYFYLNIANRGHWFLISIILSLIITTIILFISIIILFIKKTKNIKLNNS